MSKREGALVEMMAKKAKSDERAASSTVRSKKNQQNQNPFLKCPVLPEEAIRVFLHQARTRARQEVKPGTTLPLTKPFVEIEGRIGILKADYGLHEMRVASSGPKRVSVNGTPTVANAFLCGQDDGTGSQQRRAHFEGGVTRSHFVHWTMAGLSEASPISAAFGVRTIGATSEQTVIRRDLAETEMVETVYGGYPKDRRVCFPGEHNSATSSRSSSKPGRMEHKAKLSTIDLALPAAPYDLRLTLATEISDDANLHEVPPGWTTKRLKRRRSYTRRDKTFAWQLDVTEVTSSHENANSPPSVSFEIEFELNAGTTLQLINEQNEDAARKLCKQLSQQLWWMLGQINPVSDVLDVEEFLRDHPSLNAVRLALGQCDALKRFVDNGASGWSSVIGASQPPTHRSTKFIGCMPVNFSRHNIEDVQRSEDNGYFLSEKTDGVRHLLVFTGDTAVLVDRAMKGKQPIERQKDAGTSDPMRHVLSLIKPGTVFDGEVVMHRKLRRPIFIVFDVLAISTTEPILHLPFDQRLRHLQRATYRTATANRDMFAVSAVADKSIPLPLVRKNFVKRTDLDSLLSNIVEERGHRFYRLGNGETHHHLTDGIIFQPNLPYVCGTDINLLKWKYLDTVTIDVLLMSPTNRDGGDILRVGCLGDENTMVDMTRHVHLPPSERRRLEADRHESTAKIAEIGFDPTTGAWYYLTMRPDKTGPNHISTVLGTLLELAESLTTEELRYRMSVPVGARDTYRKEIRAMQKQLLEHQRRRNEAHSSGASSSR